MVDPLELAQRTARGHLDQEACTWLSEGFARWLAGDDLAHSLDLGTFTRLRSRNRALRAAANLLDPDGAPWHQAGLLAAAIRRFETRIQPLIRRDPNHQVGPADACLQRAFASGHRIPRTQRALFDLLA